MTFELVRKIYKLFSCCIKSSVGILSSYTWWFRQNCSSIIVYFMALYERTIEVIVIIIYGMLSLILFFTLDLSFNIKSYSTHVYQIVELLQRRSGDCFLRRLTISIINVFYHQLLFRITHVKEKYWFAPPNWLTGFKYCHNKFRMSEIWIQFQT